jgi:ABC-type multidrug transport system ATPase subunit
VTSAVVVEELTKDYGDLMALEGVSVDVGGGERVVLVGPNGSGKSTLLRIAAGLLEPSEGTVSVAGSQPGSLEARAAVAYVPDEPVLYDDLSVIEHLEYVARLHRATDWEDSARELLDALGLTARRDDLPSRFSRGLRQKTMIAMAFVRPFRVLLVDEPFVGLDAVGRVVLPELMDAAARDGASVIVATHELEYAIRLPRCIILRDGRVMSDGTPSRETLAELGEQH